MLRTGAARWTAVALVLLAAGRARAEEARRSAPGAAELREAAELMREGQCGRALPLLRRALDLSGDHRNALWNMGECYATEGLPGLAIEAYRDYLEHPMTRGRPRDRAAAEEAIARLEATIARIVVTSSVRGATVRVGGHEVGTTPTVALVADGVHVVEVAAAGFSTWRAEVQADAGRETAVSAVLRREPGTLRVTTEPDGAEVRIDGEPAAGPDHELPDGRHVVEVSLDGHRTERRQVDVRADERTTVEVSLEPTRGTLAVATDAAEARLEVDGEERGASPFAPLSLSPGPHRVGVAAPGHERWTGEVEVLDRRTTSVEVSMFRTGGLQPGWFWAALGTAVACLGAGTALMILWDDQATEFASLADGVDEGGEGSRDLAVVRDQGEEIAETAGSLIIGGGVLLGVGGLAAVTALVVGLFTQFSPGESTAATSFADEPGPEADDGSPDPEETP